MLPKALVDDENFGCLYLHRTLEIEPQCSDKYTMRAVDNFLRTITHPAILDCLSIDTYVGTMYNVISGTNGERAIPFFKRLCAALLEPFRGDIEMGNPTTLDSRLQAVLTALHELLRRERRVSLHDDLSGLLTQLEEIFVFLDRAAAKSGYVCTSSKDRINVLRRVSILSTNLLSNPDDNDRLERAKALMSAARSVYPVDIDPPGGRHDNDHRSIEAIHIIPTTDEMLSDKSDYLPSTDYRQPHFCDDQVERYLDTQFRLLRYDIFGPLKEVLSTLMISFENGTPSSRISTRDMNAHLYHKAKIAHISVHDRRGFEAHITFAPPPQVRRLNLSEQQHWWANSKRLEKGGLVCLICPVGDVVLPLLLLVSDKSTNYSPDTKDSSLNASLVSKSRPPTIAVKLASQVESGLQQLIQTYHMKGEGILVDLPGLIPSTFTPILKNLQKMIRAEELAFRQWIIPRPNSGNAVLVPPRYARGAGFSFCLDSITKSSASPLTLSAAASPDDPTIIDELATKTDLDRGQCQALVAALTREYALIQGPPGTGKSFLGVKLIRVLLACAEKARLGPIIIM